MTNRTNTFLGLLAAFLVFFSCACDPCGGEQGAIEIDFSDRTAPDLYWQIVTRTTTPSGPISAISIVNDSDYSLSMTQNDVVEITLLGEDNESGIEWLNLQGGFGYTCSRPDAAIALSGIVPGNRVFFNFAEGECALAEAEYPVYIIDGSNLCVNDYPNLTSGGYVLTGSGANSNIIIRQDYRITINILNAAI
ncbi:hypothetical protein [Neolewinella persica]|uniref:hypothetical protein n=1 Tax=Neolewinella persica TaxID=70998 RepID=UPI000361680E|nr:hypothetical protein [Neolewinella persica]